MLYIVLGALIIGLTLGLMGSGGSILTVPVLVYLLGHQDKAAIAESLAIVGAIALAGMIPYARAGLVDWRSVLFFGIPGMLGTYGGAWLAHFVPGPIQLSLFALVMLLAAWTMLRNKKGKPAVSDSVAGQADNTGERSLAAGGGPRKAVWLIAVEGILVGILTGLVGVGGGFLVVPALVVLGKLPMRVAVGTSLVVIAMKSFSGFAKYLEVLASVQQQINWPIVAAFVAIGIVGSLVGQLIAARMNQLALRRVFGVFLVGMGLLVLSMEAPKVFTRKPAGAAGIVPAAAIPAANAEAAHGVYDGRQAVALGRLDTLVRLAFRRQGVEP
ncbi:MAG: sulfite exporter TauE/SafE family protein [Pirellulaceae bacterium]|nr:sulfite exporter TauE/SafE family protein [Pirellulaceae bacterium]